jgi:hypothetical protein
MKTITLFTLSLLISFAALPQRKAEKLQGKWIEKSINGQKVIECPYQLELEKNYRYKVLNVCFGSDPMLPITEDGTWSYDSVKNVIILKKRNAHENDLFHDSSSMLTIRIKEYKSSSIVIYFDTEKDLTIFQKMI